ncbi:hypothetical protein CDIK_0289 [Cucumispora dikerogammari]|nr:hypothetical protein CDIK_0289 [Cucumispora dikerogammari]
MFTAMLCVTASFCPKIKFEIEQEPLINAPLFDKKGSIIDQIDQKNRYRANFSDNNLVLEFSFKVYDNVEHITEEIHLKAYKENPKYEKNQDEFYKWYDYGFVNLLRLHQTFSVELYVIGKPDKTETTKLFSIQTKKDMKICTKLKTKYEVIKNIRLFRNALDIEGDKIRTTVFQFFVYITARIGKQREVKTRILRTKCFRFNCAKDDSQITLDFVSLD